MVHSVSSEAADRMNHVAILLVVCFAHNKKNSNNYYLNNSCYYSLTAASLL